MLHIIFTTLLFIAHTSLVSMEPRCLFSNKLLSTQLSNSSSETYFFINNIDHKLSQQYHLPKDIKNKLLKKYIAITNDERIASDKYNELIDIPNYMNLNQANKRYIQMLFSTETPMIINDINNNKNIILNASPDTQAHYRKMLTLPLDIRRKMADKYSSMVLVKTTGENYMLNEKQIDKKELRNDLINMGIIGTIVITLDCLLMVSIGLPFFCIILSPKAMNNIGKQVYKKIYPLSEISKHHHYNGYELLPLLPEENGK
jgi:hypothetical protein